MEEKNIISTETAQEVAENAVEMTKKSNGTFKKATTATIIGALIAGAGYGIYRLYKRHKEKKSTEDDIEVTVVTVEDKETEE